MHHRTVFGLQIEALNPKHNSKAKSIESIWPEIELRFEERRVGVIILEQRGNKTMSLK